MKEESPLGQQRTQLPHFLPAFLPILFLLVHVTFTFPYGGQGSKLLNNDLHGSDFILYSY